MFRKTKIALSVALVLGTASAALATPPSKHVRYSSNLAASALAMSPSQVGPSGNPAFDVHDNRGVRIGADPDSRIRLELQRDQHPGE